MTHETRSAVAIQEAADEAEHRPVRVGVFSSLDRADRAVHRLLEHGFSREEISVISSDEAVQQYFTQYYHQTPSGANAPVAAAVGGAIGAAVGALGTVAAAGAAGAGVAGGSALIALTLAGGPVAWTGLILGGFVGAMMTRGQEKEAADFYDQAVTAGKILVGVEVHAEGAEARLAEAEHILAEFGAEPVSLREG